MQGHEVGGNFGGGGHGHKIIGWLGGLGREGRGGQPDWGSASQASFEGQGHGLVFITFEGGQTDGGYSCFSGARSANFMIFLFGKQSLWQDFGLFISLVSFLAIGGHFGFCSLHNDDLGFKHFLSEHPPFALSSLHRSLTALHFEDWEDPDLEDRETNEVEKDLDTCKKLNF